VVELVDIAIPANARAAAEALGLKVESSITKGAWVRQITRDEAGRTNHGAAHRANRIARRSLGTGGPGRLEFIRYPALIWDVRINPAGSGWKPAGQA
jgi:hypothetical protein